MRPILAIVMLLVPAVGCLGPGPWMEPMDIDMDWGGISIEEWNVEPREAGLMEVAARVNMVIRLVNAEDPRIVITLDGEGCSRYGPPSEPGMPAARAWQKIPTDRSNHTWTFDEELRGSAAAGTTASVFVRVEADNSIGPIFGECREHARPMPVVVPALREMRMQTP